MSSCKSLRARWLARGRAFVGAFNADRVQWPS
jgi:hypothetical protein